MARTPVMADKLPPLFLELLGDDFEVLPWETSDGSDSLRRAEAFITYGHPHVDGLLLDLAPNLKIVSNHGVGVDHVDLSAAADRNIPVGNTPGCLDGSTADMTFALILATARNVVIGDHYARSAEFTVYEPSLLIGKEVHGSTLGIVGLGRIGKQVARRAKAFDMHVLYHNRRRDPVAEAEFSAVYRTLDDLLAESDFVAAELPTDGGDDESDLDAAVRVDETVRHADQHVSRSRRRYRRLVRGSQNRPHRRGWCRRHPARTAAARSSVADDAKPGAHTASWQRVGSDSASHD